MHLFFRHHPEVFKHGKGHTRNMRRKNGALRKLTIGKKKEGLENQHERIEMLPRTREPFKPHYNPSDFHPEVNEHSLNDASNS